MAFDCVGLDWQKYVVQDPALVRPAEVDLLIGDAAKARRTAGLAAEGGLRGTGAPDGGRRPRTLAGGKQVTFRLCCDDGMVVRGQALCVVPPMVLEKFTWLAVVRRCLEIYGA